MEKVNAEVFLKVVETGSFKKTADEMGYTQAGISYIINAMEEELGLKLFSREYGGVKLTSEGKEILPHIKHLRSCERNLKIKANELKGLESGTVSVVAFSSIGIYWLPDIIKAFNKDYPDVDFELIECENREETVAMVATGDVDIGFFALPVTDEIDTIPLVEDPMMAIVSLEHPLAQLSSFPVEEMENYPYISMKYDNDSEVKDIFEELGVKPDVAYSIENDYAAMAMVSRNLGYSIFSSILLTEAPFPLKAMEFDRPVYRTIAMGTRDFKKCSHAAKVFAEYIKRWVDDNCSRRIKK